MEILRRCTASADFPQSFYNTKLDESLLIYAVAIFNFPYFEWLGAYFPLKNTGSHQRCSIKKVLLKILQNSQENICARVCFLRKLQASGVFCEFCEIFKNTYFTEHLWWLLLKEVMSNHFIFFFIFGQFCIKFFEASLLNHNLGTFTSRKIHLKEIFNKLGNIFLFSVFCFSGCMFTYFDYCYWHVWTGSWYCFQT